MRELLTAIMITVFLAPLTVEAKAGQLRPKRTGAAIVEGTTLRNRGRRLPPQTKRSVPANGARVFQFDVMRVDGLAGPDGMVFERPRRAPRRSWLLNRRSFMHRMSELVVF